MLSSLTPIQWGRRGSERRINYPETAQLFSIRELVAFFQRTSSACAQKYIWLISALCTYQLGLSSMRQGLRLLYPLSNSILGYHSHLIDEGKLALDAWMMATWTGSAWITRPLCFQHATLVHAEDAVYRWAVLGTGHGLKAVLIWLTWTKWSQTLRRPLER